MMVSTNSLFKNFKKSNILLELQETLASIGSRSSLDEKSSEEEEKSNIKQLKTSKKDCFEILKVLIIFL